MNERRYCTAISLRNSQDASAIVSSSWHHLPPTSGPHTNLCLRRTKDRDEEQWKCV